MLPFRAIAVANDRLEIHRDGGQAYASMLAAIAGATSTICLETYAFLDDALGHRFALALAERARSGVEVNILYDAWGSSISAQTLRELRSAGARLVAFHPVNFGGRVHRSFARLWRRDHRKLLTVDARVGFTGGLNIGLPYAAPEDGGRGWRDTNLRLEGPAALTLQKIFLHNWRRNQGPEVDAKRYPMASAAPTPPHGSAHLHVAAAHAGLNGLRILTSEFQEARQAIRRAYLRAIGSAKLRISLTQGYFLPPFGLRRALSRAARRGVQVHVIVGGTTDVPAVRLASRGLYGRLLRAGIRVFEWRGRVLHAKTGVIDGTWATIGSSNLDYRSLFINLEVNAVVEDRAFGGAMEELFADDLRECHEVTLEEWRNRPLLERFLSWLLYFLRAWL